MIKHTQSQPVDYDANLLLENAIALLLQKNMYITGGPFSPLLRWPNLTKDSK